MSDCEVLFHLIKNEIFNPEGRRVNLSRPLILDVMFLNNNELIPAKSLKYFCLPALSSYPLDLNLGFENYKFRHEDSCKEMLTKMEKYLMANDGRAIVRNSSKQQFFTSRNTLKFLMKTPYVRDNWTIMVTKFQGVIYMCRGQELPANNRRKEETYHFKLLQYCLSDSPHEKPETDEPVDENEQYSCIYQTNLDDDFELLYSAEIFGVESEHEIENIKNKDVLNNCRFVMSKIVLESKFPWQTHRKMFPTWIQAYLTCADKIYVGTQTRDGFINRKLEMILTRDIPKDQSWKPEVCKRFLRQFLSKVQNKMANIDCPYMVMKLDYDEDMQMVKCRVFEGKNEHSFLSEDFTKYMQNLIN